MCYVVSLFLSNPNFLKSPIFPNLFKLHRPIHTLVLAKYCLKIWQYA